MPRVPDIPLASVPRQAGVPQVAQPRVAGEAAQALGRAAQVVFEFGIKEKRAKDRRTLVTSLGALTSGLEEARQSALEADPDKILETFDSQDEALFNDIASRIEDPDLREEFELRAISIRNSDRSAVSRQAFKIQRDEGQAQLRTTLETLSDSIASSFNTLQADVKLSEGLDMIRNSEDFKDSQKEVLRLAFLESIEKKSILFLVNAGRTAETLDASTDAFDKALSLVNSKELTPNLSESDRISLRNSVKAQRQSAITEMSDKLYIGINRRVRRAETPEEISAARAEARALVEQDVIGRDQFNAFDAALDKKLERLESTGNSVEIVQASINSGLPLDRNNKDHRDHVDAYYESVFLPSISGMSTAEAIEAEAELLGQIDVLPRRVEEELRRGANSDSPQLVSVAAQRYESLRAASPQAVDDFSDQEKVLLENMAQASRLNLDPAESLKQERERLKLDKNVRTLRREKLREERKDRPDVEFLESNRGDLPLRRPFLSAPFGDPQADFIPAQMEAAFSAAVERFYLLDPRLDTARRRAFEAMSKVWGTTEVGGPGRRFMYLAPETMYPQFDGRSDEITSQLVSDVSQARPDLAGESDLASRLILTPDSRSARELDPDTGQLAPGYSVFLFDSEREDREQLFMSDGSPMRFFPDPSASEAVSEAKQKRERSIERAKGLRRSGKIASVVRGGETVSEGAVGQFSFESKATQSEEETRIQDLQTRGLLTP